MLSHHIATKIIATIFAALSLQSFAATQIELSTQVKGLLPSTNIATSLTGKTQVSETVQGFTESACTPTITAGAIAINVSTVATGCSSISTIQTLTLVANTAVTLPAAVSGQSYSLLACANGGAFSVTSWPTTNVTVKWAGGIAPVATATNGKCDLYTFVSVGSSTYGSAVLNF